ncbi:MAG TPA: amidase [Candidatus Limnocylindria bacterium]|nr:amidase [Candidatus Limnocylindria bacterium]
MSELTQRSIGWLSAAYDERRASPVEVTQATLDRIAALDGELLSYISVLADSALDEARRAEQELFAGRRRGPLDGIPIALKDLIDVAGVATTGGSLHHRDVIATADSDIVAQLRAGGAVIIGKNNLYELGMGLPMPGEWPVPARNPWDLERIPGGSSSGSAVAVLTGLCAGSYGTDTGGSIRGPASYCGVVGMKPTYDLISRRGVLALSWTLDHVGPLGRTADDVAALLAGASGSSVELGDSIAGLRIGAPQALIDSTDMEPAIGRAFDEATSVLRSLGARLQAVELPELALTEATLLAIIGSEGLANHLPALADRPDEFGVSARERLSAGLAYTGVDYVNALRMRDVVIAQLDELYRSVDVLVSPVVLQVAPKKVDFERNPPHRTPFTGIHNIVGGAAVSVPAGFDGAGMPIGMQVAGAYGADALVLTVARSYEQATDWHTRRPADPSTRTA